MTTLSEFQATRKSFDVTAADHYEYDNVPRTELQLALDSTGWADVDLLYEEQASAAHFYEFTHKEHEDGIGVYMIVKDGDGHFIMRWDDEHRSFNSLLGAEEDLLACLNDGVRDQQVA